MVVINILPLVIVNRQPLVVINILPLVIVNILHLVIVDRQHLVVNIFVINKLVVILVIKDNKQAIIEVTLAFISSYLVYSFWI